MDFEAVICMIENSGNIRVPGTSLIPDIRVNDCLLNLVMLHSIDSEIPLSMYSSITGRETQFDNLDHLRSLHFSIHADPPQRVVVDGETFGETPFNKQVHPAAVRVLSTLREENSSEEKTLQ